MKKSSLLALMFSCVIFVGFTGTNVTYATDLNGSKKTESKSIILSQNEEIVDVNKLIERAENGVTDLPVGQTESSTLREVISEKGDPVELEVKKYRTAQLLTTEQTYGAFSSEPTIGTTYAISDVEVYALSDTNKYDTKWDKSNGVVSYSTIYINKTIYRDGTFLSLVNVDGGWNIHFGGLTLSNKNVTMGQNGFGMNGIPTNNGVVENSPSGFYYGYTAPSFWAPVNKNLSGGAYGPTIGCNSSANISNGFDSWEILHINQF